MRGGHELRPGPACVSRDDRATAREVERSGNDSCRGVPDPSSEGLPGPCDKDVDRGSSPTKPLRDEATDRTVYVPYELFVGRLIDEIVAGPS